MLDFVQKRLFWLIIIAIGGGLLVVRLTGGYPFAPAFCALAALIMIYPSLVPLDFSRIREIRKHGNLIAWSLVINFILSPALAFLVGWIFLRALPDLWLGLILLSVLPGGGMVATWAYRSRADMALVVGIVFANLLAAVFLAPVYLSLAMNRLPELAATSVADASCAVSQATRGAVDCFIGGGGVNPLKIALPILVIIIIPLVLAYLTQQYLARRSSPADLAARQKKFAAASNLGMLVMIFLLLGIKDNIVVFERPDLIMRSLVPLIIFYALSLAASWILFRLRGGAEGKALAWGTYLRYITLALGLAISLVYQDQRYSLSVVMVALAYLIQIPSSFWLANIFKKKYA